MVSMRMFVSAERIVTVRRQHLMAIEDMKEALDESRGPSGAGDFVIATAKCLTERMDPKLTDLKDELEALEDDLEAAEYSPSRPRLAGIQRESITLRRYLAPQRDALAYLCTTQFDWLGGGERMRLYEIIDQITRYVENLDAILGTGEGAVAFEED